MVQETHDTESQRLNSTSLAGFNESPSVTAENQESHHEGSIFPAANVKRYSAESNRQHRIACERVDNELERQDMTYNTPPRQFSADLDTLNTAKSSLEESDEGFNGNLQHRTGWSRGGSSPRASADAWKSKLYVSPLQGSDYGYVPLSSDWHESLDHSSATESPSRYIDTLGAASGMTFTRSRPQVGDIGREMRGCQAVEELFDSIDRLAYGKMPYDGKRPSDVNDQKGLSLAELTSVDHSPRGSRSSKDVADYVNQHANSSLVGYLSEVIPNQYDGNRDHQAAYNSNIYPEDEAIVDYGDQVGFMSEFLADPPSVDQVAYCSDFVSTPRRIDDTDEVAFTSDFVNTRRSVDCSDQVAFVSDFVSDRRYNPRASLTRDHQFDVSEMRSPIVYNSYHNLEQRDGDIIVESSSEEEDEGEGVDNWT